MPVFTPGEDPGSSFADLLRRIGASADDVGGDVDRARRVAARHDVRRVRYADGVVMAGDRRATAGNLISHRAMDKVVEADRHSAVAIAGAAGPAMEMVRLFQLQLEHYEKVEGTALSLEGKANQLSMMIRGNLQAAMMGLAVVPIFGGYDLRRQVGRLFAYDVTGGRYEEREYVATGSGSLHAGTVIKVGYRPGMDRSDAVTSCAGRCGRPPTPTRRRAGPTCCATSSRSSPRSPPTASPPSTTTSWPAALRTIADDIRPDDHDMPSRVPRPRRPSWPRRRVARIGGRGS